MEDHQELKSKGPECPPNPPSKDYAWLGERTSAIIKQTGLDAPQTVEDLLYLAEKTCTGKEREMKQAAHKLLNPPFLCHPEAGSLTHNFTTVPLFKTAMLNLSSSHYSKWQAALTSHSFPFADSAETEALDDLCKMIEEEIGQMQAEPCRLVLHQEEQSFRIENVKQSIDSIFALSLPSLEIPTWIVDVCLRHTAAQNQSEFGCILRKRVSEILFRMFVTSPNFIKKMHESLHSCFYHGYMQVLHEVTGFNHSHTSTMGDLVVMNPSWNPKLLHVTPDKELLEEQILSLICVALCLTWQRAMLIWSGLNHKLCSEALKKAVQEHLQGDNWNNPYLVARVITDDFNFLAAVDAVLPDMYTLQQLMTAEMFFLAKNNLSPTLHHVFLSDLLPISNCDKHVGAMWRDCLRVAQFLFHQGDYMKIGDHTSEDPTCKCQLCYPCMFPASNPQLDKEIKLIDNFELSASDGGTLRLSKQLWGEHYLKMAHNLGQNWKELNIEREYPEEDLKAAVIGNPEIIEHLQKLIAFREKKLKSLTDIVGKTTPASSLSPGNVKGPASVTTKKSKKSHIQKSHSHKQATNNQNSLQNPSRNLSQSEKEEENQQKPPPLPPKQKKHLTQKQQQEQTLPPQVHNTKEEEKKQAEANPPEKETSV